MCLRGEKFHELCELYPQTADSLKIQGLKKRKMFMSVLALQEEEAAAGKKVLSTIIYKGHMKAHSKYRDALTGHIDDAEDESGEVNMTQNATYLSSVLLHPDEQDIESPNEKMER